MPYILITTAHGSYGGRDYSSSAAPQAVATLDETQATIDELIEEHDGSIDEWPDLPESGGTIGPLPDGTTIEVREACDGSCVLQVTPVCPACDRPNVRWPQP